MTWSFETDPEFAAELEWVDRFVREKIEPIDQLVPDPYDVADPLRNELFKPLQQEVKDRKLWACHLGPELGGPGYGQLKLALLNEILGRSRSAPTVFGTQAPDTGNAEILAHFGTEGQKERYLAPLLDGQIVSCFSMTEPQGGADPEVFTTKATRDGDCWVINGEKWYSSNARHAAFLIVMAITSPDAEYHRRFSMFIVPSETPGIDIIRHVGHTPGVDGSHGYVRYTDVRVPADHVLGGEGEAFAIAQTRLGGGRIHHAMRTVGLVQKSLDLLCRRALSRVTKGERLADKQSVQHAIAHSWAELESFRLLVLRTAWKIDRYQDYSRVRGDISAVKALMPKLLNDVASRALHLHGSIGVSSEMPFLEYIYEAFTMGLVDGPTEVHEGVLARAVLRNYKADEDVFPPYHLPLLREQAEAAHQDVLLRHAAAAGRPEGHGEASR
ncbi:acyl-CoA dehydrogenase [Actinocorallia herbida]|uniref:Acyl-CoA dehydrogenase n=1 Tax=Actinocorallia herbida TaxID=58109 RepID=A0A3N1D2T4_9ACTN|nr:acyl-CoA dehydrogenase family protein [Actinocorallia herbida]ROO87839.1 acyl-CoA dehydrogenase [Actinocorallia herbida]